MMAGNKNPITREDVESLKNNWKSDPCWDIYDTEGFEEYRDELMVFQKECEAAWERKREKERARLGSLICPLVTHVDCECNTEQCAWWCDWENACAIKVTAVRMGDIYDNLPAIGR